MTEVFCNSFSIAASLYCRSMKFVYLTLYMNSSFDFHQFLLVFIDIFKTLESVTTLSRYLKANTTNFEHKESRILSSSNIIIIITL